HLARTSWNYGLLLRAAAQPEALVDGIAFDLTFEPLHRHLALLSPGYRALAPVERRDLRRLDVPRFGFAGDDCWVRDAHGRRLASMYDDTPWATMAAALRALTPEHAQREARALVHALRPGAGQRFGSADVDAALCGAARQLSEHLL